MEATRDDPGIFFIEYVPKKEQNADILTKGFFHNRCMERIV